MSNEGIVTILGAWLDRFSQRFWLKGPTEPCGQGSRPRGQFRCRGCGGRGGWSFRSSGGDSACECFSSQFIEQRLRLFQIGGIEAFGEPAIDLGEEIAGLVAAATIAPEVGEFGRRLQLPTLCPLLPCHGERLPQARLDRLVLQTTGMQQEFCMDLGEYNHIANRHAGRILVSGEAGNLPIRTGQQIALAINLDRKSARA